MKKIISLFVMAILIVSAVPLVFAEETTAVTAANATLVEAETTDAVPTLYNKELVDKKPLPRPVAIRAKENTQERINDAKLRTQKRIAVSKERLQNTKERFEAARKRYQKAREYYTEAKDRYQEKRQTFTRAKEDWNACKDVDSEECEQKRAQVKSHAGEFLQKSANLVLKELERVKAKVEASEDLSEEEIAEIVSNLDDKISEVEDAKEVVDELGEDSTREEVNDAAKTIRNSWKRTQTHLKKAVGRLATARLQNVVVQIEQLQERFEKTKEKLEAQGKDVSSLESILDDFETQLEVAKAKYKKSRELWQNAKDEGTVNKVAKDAQALMKEAKDALVKARELLREAVKEVRGLNQGQLVVESIESAESTDSEEPVESNDDDSGEVDEADDDEDEEENE